jgi:hypothetical protein
MSSQRRVTVTPAQTGSRSDSRQSTHPLFCTASCLYAASTMDIRAKICRSEFMFHSFRQYVTLTLTEDFNDRKTDTQQEYSFI